MRWHAVRSIRWFATGLVTTLPSTWWNLDCGGRAQKHASLPTIAENVAFHGCALVLPLQAIRAVGLERLQRAVPQLPESRVMSHCCNGL
jgi:hypothetical protein